MTSASLAGAVLAISLALLGAGLLGAFIQAIIEEVRRRRQARFLLGLRRRDDGEGGDGGR